MVVKQIMSLSRILQPDLTVNFDLLASKSKIINQWLCLLSWDFSCHPVCNGR